MIKSLTLSIGMALTLATPAFGAIEWGFDANANAANATDGPGSGATTAIPRTLENAQGDRDLGKSGSIVLLRGLGLDSPVSLQVFPDSGTYGGGPTNQINNGPVSFLSFAQITESPGQGSWQQWIAAFSLKPDDIVKNTAPSGGAIIDRMVLTVVPQPAAVIAGALLLVPFGSSTIRMLRRDRGSAIA